MKTKSKIVKHDFVPGTSRGKESSATLRLRMARDLERRVAQADRLKLLRRPLGNGRFEVTQPEAAEAAGVTLRAYQFWEAGTTEIEHDNLKRLAAFFGVEPDWIVNGDREPGQLDRIEAKLDAILLLLGDGLGKDADDALAEFAPAPPESRLPVERRASRRHTA